MVAPRFLSQWGVARGVRYVGQESRWMKRTDDSRGVVRSRERDDVDAEIDRARRGVRIAEVVPGVRVTGDVHQRGRWASKEGLVFCM